MAVSQLRPDVLAMIAAYERGVVDAVGLGAA
jgi:hypothetical protein